MFRNTLRELTCSLISEDQSEAAHPAVPQIVLLAFFFFKIGATFAFFLVMRDLLDLHDTSNVRESSLAMALPISPWMQQV